MIIAFANQKGGVAKTTTCLNLGAGLAMRGYSARLVDSDPQASLSCYLGAEAGKPTLGDWLMDRVPFDQVVRATPHANLSYVATNERLIADESLMEQDKFKAIHAVMLSST